MSTSPSTLYVPQPLSIVNYDFEASPGTLPPTGWQAGGMNLAAAVLSYDTTTPYEGSNSLILTASAQFQGASSIATFPVIAGQVWSISAAIKSIFGDPAYVQLTWFTAAGGFVLPAVGSLPSASTSATSWEVVSAQGTVPVGAAYGQIQLFMAGVSGGIGEFDVIEPTLLSSAIPAYLSLFTSEYQNSPNLKALATALMQPFIDVAMCTSGMNAAFSLATSDPAIGPQLDTLGVILGVSRQLPFNPVGVNALTTEAVSATGLQTVTTNNTTYMQINVPQNIGGASPEGVIPTAIVQGVSFTAVFNHTHLSGVSVTTPAPSSTLGDADYLVLLQAKVIQNQFNGQYQGSNSTLWQDWQSIFPGWQIYITDNQNMTATVFLVGEFTILQQQMILNHLIVPEAETVEFIYEFATFPIFGWGSLNPTFVAGWGTGSGTYPGGNWA